MSDDGRDWTTRHMGSVTDHSGDRMRVSWDPKCGGPIVRLDGDKQVPCAPDDDGTGWCFHDTPDDDGWCRELSAWVGNFTPDQADALAAMLTEAAIGARAFFATADEVMELADDHARKHHLTRYPRDGALRELARVSEAQRETARAALDTAVRRLVAERDAALAEAAGLRDAVEAVLRRAVPSRSGVLLWDDVGVLRAALARRGGDGRGVTE